MHKENQIYFFIYAETLAGIAFSGDYVLLYFFLDKKVTKNQGFRKKAKNLIFKRQ